MVSRIIAEWRENKIGADGKTVSVDYVELRGLSADEKPTENIYNGSVFIETDTKKVFYFDADSGTWI